MGRKGRRSRLGTTKARRVIAAQCKQWLFHEWIMFSTKFSHDVLGIKDKIG